MFQRNKTDFRPPLFEAPMPLCPSCHHAVPSFGLPTGSNRWNRYSAYYSTWPLSTPTAGAFA